MPPKDPNAYMRDYRARKKQPQEAPAKAETVTGEKKPWRTIDSTWKPRVYPSGYRSLPEDDWVRSLTQEQRDAILSHPAANSKKRER
jgi:hypothetical protein